MIYQEFKNQLKKSMFVFLLNSIEYNENKFGDQFIAETEKYLELLYRAHGTDDFIKIAVNAYIKFNKDILKEELVFKKTGKYSQNDYGSVVESVYENQAVMGDFYLVGLYLTYFFWPHHYELLQFYKNYFLSAPQKVDSIMEWGVGHGLLSLMALERWPRARLDAYDISSFSIEFAQQMIGTAGYTNCGFHKGDVLAQNIDSKADLLICGELLEHLPEPIALVEKIGNTLSHCGVAFLTGAVNAAQLDHITLFETEKEIVDMVTITGLKVKAQASFVHPSRANDKKAPIVVALVVGK